MILRLECRNKLHKCNFLEIMKAKTRRSKGTHANLWNLGFAWSIQIRESLFRGNEAKAHKLETNAHTNFPMLESIAYQCMENGR